MSTHRLIQIVKNTDYDELPVNPEMATRGLSKIATKDVRMKHLSKNGLNQIDTNILFNREV